MNLTATLFLPRSRMYSCISSHILPHSQPLPAFLFLRRHPLNVDCGSPTHPFLPLTYHDFWTLTGLYLRSLDQTFCVIDQYSYIAHTQFAFAPNRAHARLLIPTPCRPDRCRPQTRRPRHITRMERRAPHLRPSARPAPSRERSARHARGRATTNVRLGEMT